MSQYNLSPSALADSVGVPRSSVSHLLTGRNRPSLDFILKLIKEYPDVNLYWLLLGKGSFPSTPNPETSPKTLPLTFSEEEKETVAKAPVPDKQIKSVAKQAAVSENSAIESIVFFFKDGTFKSFEPK